MADRTRMAVRVTSLSIRSGEASDRDAARSVTITISDAPEKDMWGKVRVSPLSGDLPVDMRDALRKWLGLVGLDS